MEVVCLDKKVQNFIFQLDRNTSAKMSRIIDLLEEFGHTLRYPFSRKIGDKLFELCVRGKIEVRVFYTFHNCAAVLIHGFVKKTQKTPKREVLLAYKKIKLLYSI